MLAAFVGFIVIFGLIGFVLVGGLAALHALTRLRDLEEKRRKDDTALQEIDERLRRLETALAARVEPIAAPAVSPAAPLPAIDRVAPEVRESAPAPAPLPAPGTSPPPKDEAPPATWSEAVRALRAGHGLTLADETTASVDHAGPPPVLPAPPAPGERVSWIASFDWENVVGVKLFSWIAGIALALAAIFFLGYSIQKGWLQPPVQMAIGLVVGTGLLVGCETRVARRFAVTANALDASGIVILFSTVFAAFAHWHLVGIPVAFASLAIVTVIGVLLSIRRDSLFIAGLGLVGGFLTPALLSTGQDNPLGLFGYLFALNAGLAWVAYHKRWPLLTSASVALTTLYQWGWVSSFMRPDRIPLAAGIFLIFPLLSVAALALGREPASASSASDEAGLFSATTDVSAVLPLLFAMYLAAVPGYGQQTAFVFGFLFCVCAGLFALALARGQQALHVIGGASALAVTVSNLASSYHPGAWPAIIAWIALLALFYLAAEWIAAAVERPLERVGGWATAAAPLLLFGFVVLAVYEPATREPWLLFGTLFVLGAAVAAASIRFERPVLHLMAVAVTAVALLTWLPAYQRPEMAVLLAGVSAAIAVIWTWPGRPHDRVEDREPYSIATVVAVVAAELVAVFAGAVPTANVPILTLAHVVFLAAFLWIATARRWYWLVTFAVVPAALAIVIWIAARTSPGWQPELLLAGGLYLVFLIYPFVFERRAIAANEPWLAAVLASGLFFLTARDALITGGFEPVIGLLPLAQAGLMGLLLLRLLGAEPAGARHLGRLALVAGAGLAFVTVAIPLQLEKQWITIGWALEGVALAWLFRHIPHRGLLAACVGLLTVVFIRLTFNVNLLLYYERGPRILNWYLYTYLVSALSLLAAGRLLAATGDRLKDLPRASTLAIGGGVTLLFVLLNIEIADFYSVGSQLTFNFGATLAQDLTYTLAWALFAVALLAAGIIGRSHAARIGAIILLVVTVMKGFLHDVAGLGGLYRVFSFVGLAVCLALVAIVLQRFVLRPGEKGSGI